MKSWDTAGAPEKETLLPDNRHGARQLALQVLYWNLSSPGEVDLALQELSQRSGLSAPVRTFAADLVHTAITHTVELEERIAAAAIHWEQNRIARIDRIILRLALSEMFFFEDIPVRVSIDEAIQLAKRYSSEQAYAFINGILDAIARQRALPL